MADENLIKDTVEDRREGKAQRLQAVAPVTMVDAEALVKAMAAQRDVPTVASLPVPEIVRCSVTVLNHQHGSLPYVYQGRDRDARIRFDRKFCASDGDAGEKKFGDTVRLTKAGWEMYGPAGVVSRKDI